jgi:hypothetical protein
VNSADRWSDVPAGTMDEASPFRILMPAVSLTPGRLVRRILLIPSWEGPSGPLPKRSEDPCE